MCASEKGSRIAIVYETRTFNGIGPPKIEHVQIINLKPRFYDMTDSIDLNDFD